MIATIGSFLLIIALQIGSGENVNLSVVAAQGCQVQVYIDGVNTQGNLPSDKTSYPKVYKVPLPPIYSSVAIAMTPTASSGFVMAFNDDLTVKTNSSWICKQKTAPANWTTVSADDLRWSHPYYFIQLYDYQRANSLFTMWYKIAACSTTVCNAAAAWLFSYSSSGSKALAPKLFCRIDPVSSNSVSLPSPDPTAVVEDDGPSFLPLPPDLPTHYLINALDTQIYPYDHSDCFTDIRSRILCAQKCSINWPHCVGFQHSSLEGECCLLDHLSLFKGSRQFYSGCSLWQAI